MEVEEDADAEREDLKAREARKKVLKQILCICICTYVPYSLKFSRTKNFVVCQISL